MWDVLSDDLAVEIVKESLSRSTTHEMPFGDPNVAALTLRDCAYLAGSGDNISVVVLVF